jgi:MEMO1 family protein
MSLKLAAIVPHPPLLVPSLGKENILRLEKTKNSYGKLQEMLALEKIETIFIISSHGQIKEDIWGIDIAPEYEINFEEFGNYSIKMKVGGDLELAQNIRESLIENEQVQAIYQPILDYGCGVPLYSLLSTQKNIEVVPFYISGQSLKDHFELGKKIGREIEKGRKKIAVLASSDLSHTLEKTSPASFSPKASRFDQKIIEILQKKAVDDLLNIEEKIINEVKPCGLQAIAVLLGILDNKGYDIDSTAYEFPFGIGHLSMILKPLLR